MICNSYLSSKLFFLSLESRSLKIRNLKDGELTEQYQDYFNFHEYFENEQYHDYEQYTDYEDYEKHQNKKVSKPKTEVKQKIEEREEPKVLQNLIIQLLET